MVSFESGQHIVCIDGQPCCCGAVSNLTSGTVYTVKAVFTAVTVGGIGVTLQEVEPPAPSLMHTHLGFSAELFRPAASIATFQKLLKKVPVREDA